MRLSPVICVLSALVLGGCVSHVRPYKPKVRKYKAAKYSSSKPQAAEGSLWSDTTSTTLYSVGRSLRIGDLVTVRIDESASATRGANTDLSRDSETSLGINAFAGAMKLLQSKHPSVTPGKLVEAFNKNSFSGKGETRRSGQLQATLTARIKRVLPNGDFYIEGSKVVMVNEEESHFYLSGVVRPSDLEADNEVSSGLLADVQIEYTGRGPVSDKQKPGWFSRFLDMITPF